MRWKILILCTGVAACRLEPPDPAAEMAAIFHKHPSSFLDRVIAFDALITRQFPNAQIQQKQQGALSDSLAGYRKRLLAEGFAAQSPAERTEALVHFLFDTLQIIPDENGAELGLSQPSQILLQRRGSCVGLGLIILALAELLDVEACPVLLPSHLFIRLRSGTESWRNVELLRGGIARSDSFYRAQFQLPRRPWYTLNSGSPDQALAALAFNLANEHLRAGNASVAMEEYQRVLEQIPGHPDALGCAGAILLSQGKPKEALESLSASLAGDSLSPATMATLALARKRLNENDPKDELPSR